MTKVSDRAGIGCKSSFGFTTETRKALRLTENRWGPGSGNSSVCATMWGRDLY